MANKITGLVDKEKGILCEAIDVYKDEIKKLMKKCEKLGLEKEAEEFKETFLGLEALRIKLSE